MNRTELLTNLREIAEQVIVTSNNMLAAVERGEAAPEGVYDPEPWTVKRAFARKILAAVETGERVDPNWLIGIGRARAFGGGLHGAE
jgi:hypothetical protein